MRWESLREMRSRAGLPDRGAATGWTPVADVSETDDRYMVVLELPGVAREQIDVAATVDALTIQGTRSGHGCEPAQYVRLERGHGRFARHFSFATRIDAAAVSADLRDGVLTVILPKAAEGRGRRVDVG